MPWRQMTLMYERNRFVFEMERGGCTFAELCDRYGIARKTGYKWLARYQELGLQGLRDRSRAPHTSPLKTPLWVEELLVSERHKHPTWGPAKLLEMLRIQHGIKDLPARSTAALILKRHGLVKQRKRYRSALVRRWGDLTVPAQPNEVWTMDFKGWFRTRDGIQCHPLTVCDLFSRYVLGCTALNAPTTKATEQSLCQTFEEFGLPVAIRVDNGSPFGAVALGGLSRLSLGWVKLGINVEFIKPGHPEQNGCHERMHRTLKQDTTQPPAGTLKRQQQRFDVWREEFNTLRPHEALSMQPPASIYTKSDRPMPGEMPEFSYPTWYETRRVKTDGTMSWNGRNVFLGEVFTRTTIGLQPTSRDTFLVYAGPILLGELDAAGSGGLRRPPEPASEN